jgi:hypothetical protein
MHYHFLNIRSKHKQRTNKDRYFEVLVNEERKAVTSVTMDGLYNCGPKMAASATVISNSLNHLLIEIA